MYFLNYIFISLNFITFKVNFVIFHLILYYY